MTKSFRIKPSCFQMNFHAKNQLEVDEKMNSILIKNPRQALLD